MIKTISFFILLISNVSFAWTGQTFSNDISEENGMKSTIKEYDSKKSYLKFIEESDEYVGIKSKGDAKKSYLFNQQDSKSDIEKRKKSIKETGNKIIGTYENSEEYIVRKKSALVREISYKGNSTFGFGYFINSFAYKDDSGIFKKVFEDDPKSSDTGILQIYFHKFIYRGVIDISAGLNLSASQHKGRGKFETSGDYSTMYFKLVTIPLDLALALEMPVTTWIKLSGASGPSIVGLSQSRTDFGKNEDGRRRRQVGYGYFVDVRFKFSISNVFPSNSINIFEGMGITKMFFDINYRMQSYSNFQDPVDISGSSIGLGFSFEFI